MAGGNHHSPVVQVALGDTGLPRYFVTRRFVNGDEEAIFRQARMSYEWDNETRRVMSGFYEPKRVMCWL